jgi:hypothetical protein
MSLYVLPQDKNCLSLLPYLTPGIRKVINIIDISKIPESSLPPWVDAVPIMDTGKELIRGAEVAAWLRLNGQPRQLPQYYGQAPPQQPEYYGQAQYYGQAPPKQPEYYGQAPPQQPQYYGQAPPQQPQYYGQAPPQQPQYHGHSPPPRQTPEYQQSYPSQRQSGPPGPTPGDGFPAPDFKVGERQKKEATSGPSARGRQSGGGSTSEEVDGGNFQFEFVGASSMCGLASSGGTRIFALPDDIVKGAASEPEAPSGSGRDGAALQSKAEQYMMNRSRPIQR